MLSMRKALLFFLYMSILITGCSEKTPTPEAVDIRCRIDGALAPEWACASNQPEGMVTAVGSAPFSKLGLEFSKHEAMSNARSNLAQQIQTLVVTKVKAFSQSNDLGDDTIVNNIARDVAKQAAKKTLKRSEQLKFWQNENTKDVYVLVGVAQDTLNSEINAHVRSAYKADDALWQQFESKGASRSLDKAFPTDML